MSGEGDDKINEKIESEPDEGSQGPQPPLIYINSLPARKLTLQQQRQSILDTGTKMLQAELDYIESLTSILVTLANYYSPKQFGDQTPQEFISEAIESRFQWYDAIVEPLGPGTGGRIAQLLVTADVASDIEKMIEDMVSRLYITILKDNFNYKEWKKAWRNSGSTPETND